MSVQTAKSITPRGRGSCFDGQDQQTAKKRELESWVSYFLIFHIIKLVVRVQVKPALLPDLSGRGRRVRMIDFESAPGKVGGKEVMKPSTWKPWR